MQIIGAETFKMPPPKRNGPGDDETTAAGLLFGDCAAVSGLPPGAVPADGFHDMAGMGIPMNGHLMAQQPPQAWRTLRLEDAPQLVRGVNVKVYRADERWHTGVLENVRLPTPPVVSECGVLEKCASSTFPAPLFLKVARLAQFASRGWRSPVHTGRAVTEASPCRSRAWALGPRLRRWSRSTTGSTIKARSGR